MDAPAFLIMAGYDPAEHPAVVAELERAVPKAILECAIDVLRAHGLRSWRDPLAPFNSGEVSGD